MQRSVASHEHYRLTAASCCLCIRDMAMRALIQRVARAEVRVADTIVGAIDRGLLVLLGVREGDTVRDVEYLVVQGGDVAHF